MAFVEMGSPMIFRTHPFDELALCAMEKGQEKWPYLVPACTIGFWAFSHLNNIVPRLVFALGGQTLGGRLEGLLIGKAQGRAKTFNLVYIALQLQFICKAF